MSAKGKQDGFTFDNVAALLSAILPNNPSVSMAQYTLMSERDNSRSAYGYQHQFRAVLKRAKELQSETPAGEAADSMKPKPKGVNKKVTPTKKRARNAKVEDYDDEVEAGDAGTPREKKPKLEDDGQDMLLTPPEFGDSD